MSYLRPVALASFLLFATHADVGEAQNTGDAVSLLTVAPSVDGEVIEMSGSSACSCPQFRCGKVRHGACEISCEAPSVAKCVCGSCTEYYRDNTCDCLEQ